MRKQGLVVAAVIAAFGVGFGTQVRAKARNATSPAAQEVMISNFHANQVKFGEHVTVKLAVRNYRSTDYLKLVTIQSEYYPKEISYRVVHYVPLKSKSIQKQLSNPTGKAVTAQVVRKVNGHYQAVSRTQTAKTVILPPAQM